VEEVMERFDTSGDGQLDRKEVRAILEELAEIQDEEADRINGADEREMEPEEWNKLSLHERIVLGRKGVRPRFVSLGALDSSTPPLPSHSNPSLTL
jgi:hypothetical protein